MIALFFNKPFCFFFHSTGVLIYEMLVGYPPFYADNPFGIYEKILNGKYEWPRLVDPVAKDLVKKLLVPDRTKRLGNMKNGAEDIRRHRWFKHLDWNEVYHRRVSVSVDIHSVTEINLLTKKNCFFFFKSFCSRQSYQK